MDQLKYRRILISCAVRAEAAIILESLDAKTLLCDGGKELFKTRAREADVFLVVTGPGMINSAHGTTFAIEKIAPDLVIQTGCAGVFRGNGLGIGDVAVATMERDIHSGIESNEPDQPPLPLPFDVPGTAKDGSIPVSANPGKVILDVLKLEPSDFMTGSGPFVTVSTVTATDERAALIAKWYNPVMESMEGASSALVARLYGIDFVEVRSASNYVGKRDKESWNLPLAFRNSSSAILTILKSL